MDNLQAKVEEYIKTPTTKNKDAVIIEGNLTVLQKLQK